MALSLVITFAAFVTIQAESSDKWNYLTSGPWHGREGLMGTFFKDHIWMSGGRYSPPSFKHINESVFYNDVWKLDPSCIKHSGSCKWELVSKDNEWEGRGYHIMFNHTVNKVDYMYIIGGQNLSTFYNDVWRSEDGKKWEQVLPSGHDQWHVRAGLAAVSYPKEGMIYLSSGCFDEFPNRQTLNDLWRSKDGSKWEPVISNQAESAMHVRSGGRIQIWDDTLYMVAGEHGFSETRQLGDIWKVDLKKIHSDTTDVDGDNGSGWELVLAESPWVNRSGHGFVVDHEGIFWIAAGYYDLHDLWRSEDLGKKWERVDRGLFDCKLTEIHCGRYDFWAQLDGDNNLFLYGGDSDWNTFGGVHNETYERSLDSYK